MAVEVVREYYRANPAAPVSLPAAARLVGKSPSRLSHLFRAQLGASFQETVIRIKLAHGASLLRRRPPLSVKEVAVAVGYDDQLYFSRLFRNYCGSAPSEARRGGGKPLKVTPARRSAI